MYLVYEKKKKEKKKEKAKGVFILFKLLPLSSLILSLFVTLSVLNSSFCK